MILQLIVNNAEWNDYIYIFHFHNKAREQQIAMSNRI